MLQKVRIAELAMVFVALHCTPAASQSLQSTSLVVDLQNVVEYQGDIADPAKFASNPNPTPSNVYKNFGVATLLGDIVAVNGQPARGAYAGRSRAVITSPAPSPGGAIADVTRTAIREQIFEILTADGTPVGTIISLGFSGGPGPPGAPSNERANWAIVGGTGAYLGARGQVDGLGGQGRAASMAEDPANRRTNGGTAFSLVIHVIPMSVPQIVVTAEGPAVTHSSDFTVVNASRPATAGEVLSVFATGLGPTNPPVDIGQPYPSSPLAPVNSPVMVKVNGKAAEIVGAVGYPGSVDGYQVNFRVPPGITSGVATVQLSTAWIPGPPVSIPMR